MTDEALWILNTEGCTSSKYLIPLLACKVLIDLRWCQSPGIETSIGDPPSDRFRIPRDLLRHRSRFFREQLERLAASSSEDSKATNPAVIHLPKTSLQTAEAFFIWSLSPQPEVDVHAPFDDILRLGVFGWTFRVPSLSNQVNDLIRGNLAEGVWKLRADLVDEVYAATSATTVGGLAGEGQSSVSPLRELIREALGQLPRSTVESDEGREAWKATILKHSQFAWDYIEAGGKEWSKEKFLEGSCRFHDHRGVYLPEGEGVEVELDDCSYKREELFPSDEAQKRRDTLRKITGREWEAGRGGNVIMSAAEDNHEPDSAVEKADIAAVNETGAVARPAIATTEIERNESTGSATVPNMSSVDATAPAVSHAASIAQAPTADDMDETFEVTPVRKAATTQVNETSVSISDAFEDEVNGTITFKTMIDKANSGPKSAAVSSPTYVKEPGPEPLRDSAAPVVAVVNGNGNAVVDSESALDEADGITVTSESAKEESQVRKVNGESGKSLGVIEKVVDGGEGGKFVQVTPPGLVVGKNKKKKKGSMSKA